MVRRGSDIILSASVALLAASPSHLEAVALNLIRGDILVVGVDYAALTTAEESGLASSYASNIADIIGVSPKHIYDLQGCPKQVSLTEAPLTASHNNISPKALPKLSLSFGVLPQELMPVDSSVANGYSSLGLHLYTVLVNSDSIAYLKQTTASILAPWSAQMYADVHKQLARIIIQACDTDGDGQLNEEEMRKPSALAGWKTANEQGRVAYMDLLASFPGNSHGVTEAMLPIVLNGYYMADVACKLGNQSDIEPLGVECDLFKKVSVSKNGELDIQVWPILNAGGVLTDFQSNGTVNCRKGLHGRTRASWEELGPHAENVVPVSEAKGETNFARHVSGFFLLLMALIMNFGVLALLCGVFEGKIVRNRELARGVAVFDTDCIGLGNYDQRAVCPARSIC